MIKIRHITAGFLCSLSLTVVSGCGGSTETTVNEAPAQAPASEASAQQHQQAVMEQEKNYDPRSGTPSGPPPSPATKPQ